MHMTFKHAKYKVSKCTNLYSDADEWLQQFLHKTIIKRSVRTEKSLSLLVLREMSDRRTL